MKAVKAFDVGASVQWIWMGRPVKGIVRKIYFKPVSRTFRGHLLKRNGSSEKPAYLVKSEAGSDGFGITVFYWKSLTDIQKWKNHL